MEKGKNGLSAGRVQSVALKLICEREKEVEAFIPEEYWSLEAEFSKGKTVFPAQLFQYKGEKPVLKSGQDVNDLIAEIESAQSFVSDIKESEKLYAQRHLLRPLPYNKLRQTVWVLLLEKRCK